MTQGRVHVTDYTNASRTMLFNIHSLRLGSKNPRSAEYSPQYAT